MLESWLSLYTRRLINHTVIAGLQKETFNMSRIYKVELRKITSVHNALDKDLYIGTTLKLPEVGQHFGMWIDSSRMDEVGSLVTTEVKEVTPVVDSETGKRAVVFKTKNSIYSLAYEEYKNESAIQESATAQKENSAGSAS